MKESRMMSGVVQRLSSFSKGLRGKFILLISALLITTSMALGWIFLVREVRDEATKLVQKGSLILRNLAIDANGNLLIGDDGNSRIRKVDLATGIITTYAGNDKPQR